MKAAFTLAITVLLLSCIPVTSIAQTPVEVEDSLKFHLDLIRVALDDSSRISAHKRIELTLSRALLKPEVFHYPFSGIESMAILGEPGEGIRVFSWYIPMNHQSPLYGAVIVRFDKKAERCYVDVLHQKVVELPNNQSAVNEKNWPGALYYAMQPVKSKGRNYYLLFGWRDFDELSNQKVVEVLYYQSKRMRMGLPVFLRDGKSSKRLDFRYSKEAVFSLNYYPGQEAIVFDHLGPTHPSLEGQEAHYVPQQSFHAFTYEKGKWIFQEEIDFKRSKGEKDGPYNDPGKPDFKQERGTVNPLTGD